MKEKTNPEWVEKILNIEKKELKLPPPQNEQTTN